MGIVSDSKDRLLEKVALAVLNSSVLQPYGRAMNLRLDPGAKTITFDLDLKGEAEFVRVQIKNYELIQEGDCSYAIIKEFQTSREWLTALAERHLVNRRLRLSPPVASVLFRFL